MFNFTCKTGTHLLILLLLAMAFWMSVTIVKATPYTTQDGLALEANGSGRVGSGGLTIGGISITFCPGLDGGFYLRDNTPGVDGLPDDIDNELLCGEFTNIDPAMDCGCSV